MHDLLCNIRLDIHHVLCEGGVLQHVLNYSSHFLSFMQCSTFFFFEETLIVKICGNLWTDFADIMYTRGGIEVLCVGL